MQPEYQKWVAKLIGYNFEIKFKHGKENKVTDALSRIPITELTQFGALILPKVLEVSRLKEEVANNSKLASIKEQLENGFVDWPGYTLNHGNLLYKG